MFLKRLFALICAVVMFACIPAVQADEADFAAFTKVSDKLYYQGGVVMRGFVKGADTSSEPLDLAYVLTTMPYIILGQQTTWEVIISGGEGPYSCHASLAYQDMSKDPFKDYWTVPDSFNVKDDTFNYTFTKPGRYFWEFRVMDTNGQFFIFQTRIYETFTEADETDELTTAGKANKVVAEVITPGMSIYDRARALHDWLIYNANYDYSSDPYRDASGVLVHGRGVCDSYARAYLMLCTIAGIDCIYLSGTAYSGGAWGAHGWNMIKLDGKWYHVDCTWDDPGTGGYECHTYFCVDDETLAKDHRWNRPDNIIDEGYIPPESEGGEYENTDSAGYYDFTFSTWEEFFSEFDKMVAEGKKHEKTYGLYVGPLTSMEMWNTMSTYASEKTQELFRKKLATSAGGRGLSGDIFYYQVGWKKPSSYITIVETSLRVTAGDNALIIPKEYYPKSAKDFTWTSSNTSVATVTATYDNQNGLIATVTGISTGTATITVTPKGGEAATITVTVLPAYAPDFDFELEVDDDEIELEWNAIPGITEYQIIRVVNGAETVLATTRDTEYDLTKAQLPSDMLQQVYILALRKVGGEIVASYKSAPVSYGKFKPTFESSLPIAMKEICDDAFADCIHLTSFDISSDVTTIGYRAFSGCTSLTTIRIPASVRSIGADAFRNCPLQYAVVEKGSYADSWLQNHFPDVQLIY
ncbi:MAG: leucine-rich repeat protein [Oscillospiraceae bacterium]|nr:leucine-rich repeat protein [Oscillospiraceae bacterium]